MTDSRRIVLLSSPHRRPFRAIMSSKFASVREVEKRRNRTFAHSTDSFVCTVWLLVCSLELGQV